MDLTSLSATALRQGLDAHTFSAADLMAATLDRIEVVNPALNAIVSLRPREELMAEAHAADRSPKGGPLSGIPMAVKDLVATKGLRTTWGSPVFADHVPAADDLVAARLRAAGAIFIGKTNVPEWGQGSHSFNPIFGVTRNPYDTGLSAGGSSGGAAAALAARMVAIADGSDMMGSLRNPAAFCNVYGFRPTWGLVPGDAGQEAFLSTLATEGPMARNVQDLALLLDCLAGPNPEMPFDRATPRFSPLEPASLAGRRIGWLGDWGGAYTCEPGILAVCETALKTFADLGATIEPVAAPFPAEKLWDSWITLRAMLNASGKRALYDNPKKRALTKPETIWEIERGLTLSAAEVYAASQVRSDWFATAARLFDRYDALVLPTAQVWPFPADWRWPKAINDRKMDTYHRWMEVVIPASLAGLPALNVPVGFGANGLPMGMQLISRTGADLPLLAMAEAYHRATDWPGRYPPPL